MTPFRRKNKKEIQNVDNNIPQVLHDGPYISHNRKSLSFTSFFQCQCCFKYSNKIRLHQPNESVFNS